MRSVFEQFVWRDQDVQLPDLDLAEYTQLASIRSRLSERPAGSFRDVNEVANETISSPYSTISFRITRALRDLFIGLADGQLQRLYRDRFQDFPPHAAASHEERIAMLDGVREMAFALVNEFNWAWLEQWLNLDRFNEDAGSCLDRLSNFAFECKRVNFRFTYHCNIACRHCYNNSGPDAKNLRLDLNTMLGIIAQMPDARVPCLNLTGGEPFLYADELTVLIAAARSAGVREISIHSNGFWGATATQADTMLMRLQSAGFMASADDFIKLSAGAYHQEFIGFDRIVTVARSYYRQFKRPLLVDFEGPVAGAGWKQRVRRELDAAGVLDKVRAQFRRISPLGRGAGLEVGRRQSFAEVSCDKIDQITFDPDGVVRPCCGFNNENYGVVIGRSGYSLRQLIKRMQNDPILQLLAGDPMNAIFEHVESAPNPAGYVTACHLCQEALGAVHDKEPLQARLFHTQRFYPFWFRG